MASVLLLDRTTNDLCLTAGNTIAVATAPYATSQSVANALKLRLGEYWYNTTIGVDYDRILGGSMPLSWVKAQFEKAALTVPGVLTATCYITSLVNRNLIGQVQYTTATSSGITGFTL